MSHLSLLTSMLRLLYPPHSTTADDDLIAAIERNTAATRELSERAGNVDRALANIHDAAEGLFV